MEYSNDPMINTATMRTIQMSFQSLKIKKIVFYEPKLIHCYV